MIQGTWIGMIRGTINKIDPWKMMQCILLILPFLVLVIIMIFIGLFGHIISDELHTQRIQVLEAIEKQNLLFDKAIKKLHPHFLIESPIHQIRIDANGTLYIDETIIRTNEDLQRYISLRNHRLKQLEGLFDHHD